jgi:hypothetical protein
MGLGSEPGNKRTATIRTPENEDVRTLVKYVFDHFFARWILS